MLAFEPSSTPLFHISNNHGLTCHLFAGFIFILSSLGPRGKIYQLSVNQMYYYLCESYKYSDIFFKKKMNKNMQENNNTKQFPISY